MGQSNVASIALSVIGIILCGGIGGFAGWSLIFFSGWTGVVGALLAVAVGMVTATATWIAITSALRSLRWIR
jgi:hypothetical protein